MADKIKENFNSDESEVILKMPLGKAKDKIIWNLDKKKRDVLGKECLPTCYGLIFQGRGLGFLF